MTGIFKIRVREPADAWQSDAARGVTSQTTLGAMLTALGGGAAGIALFLTASYSAIRTAISAVHDGMLNAGQLSGFRNRIINGDMAIDQRNAGAAINPNPSTFTYPVDRWGCHLSTTYAGTITAQRVANAGATDARYALRLLRSAGTYAGVILLQQAVETANSVGLAGKKVILSFKARKGSAFVAGLTAALISGTGTDQSLTNMVGGAWTAQATTTTAPALTTSFQTFSVSATIGASVTQIGVQFYTGAFTGSGGANDYVDITDVQIEVCDATIPAATPFERRPIATELALCQRYYEKSNAQGTAPGAAPGGGSCSITYGHISNNLYAPIPFKVTKRASPTVTTYDGAGASGKVSYYVASWNNGGTPSTISGNDNGLYVQGNIASAILFNFDWAASAEL